jgi:DNA-directed RNA polymerase subunit RPC12/RpoP
MTIEVIRKGQLPSERTVRGSCSHCRAELQWKAKDGQHGSCQRDGEWNTVKCPECGHSVIGDYQTRT